MTGRTVNGVMERGRNPMDADTKRLIDAARALLKAGPEAEEYSDAEMDLEELLNELEAKAAK